MATKKRATKTGNATRARSPLRVGCKVFIRTVTNYYTGRIVLLTKDEVVLDDCAWIAWTKRFSESMSHGEFDEIEPYPDGVLVSVGRGAIVDACAWSHALPRCAQ